MQYGIKIIRIGLLTVSLACAPAVLAKASSYDRIVVFGSSLSDTGNAFTLINNATELGFGQCNLGVPLNKPPYDQMDKLQIEDEYYELLVPDGVYARGGHHLTNGKTWIEQFAFGQGLSGTVRPALLNSGLKASNYAVGGARARPVTDDTPANAVIRCRFNLSDQVNAYLTDYQIGVSTPISGDTLFVIEIGGNDVRDALNVLLETYDQQAAEYLIGQAINQIAETMQTLYAFGARHFVLVNVPNIARTPTVSLLDQLFTPPPTPSEYTIAYNANLLSAGFNAALSQLQAQLAVLPDIKISTLNLYGLLEEIIADQVDNGSKLFGITNVTDACITPNQPPFTCKKPDTYLFWDGVHPTKTVHGFMAQRAAEAMGEAY